MINYYRTFLPGNKKGINIDSNSKFDFSLFVRTYLTVIIVATALVLLVVKVVYDVLMIEHLHRCDDYVRALTCPSQTLHTKHEPVNQLTLALILFRQHEESDLAHKFLGQASNEQRTCGHYITLMFNYYRDHLLFGKLTWVIEQFLFHGPALVLLNIVDDRPFLIINMRWLQILLHFLAVSIWKQPYRHLITGMQLNYFFKLLIVRRFITFQTTLIIIRFFYLLGRCTAWWDRALTFTGHKSHSVHCLILRLRFDSVPSWSLTLSISDSLYPQQINLFFLFITDLLLL